MNAPFCHFSHIYYIYVVYILFDASSSKRQTLSPSFNQKKLRKIRARLRMSKKSCTFAAVFNLRYSARTCIYMDFEPPTLLHSGVGGR